VYVAMYLIGNFIFFIIGVVVESVRKSGLILVFRWWVIVIECVRCLSLVLLEVVKRIWCCVGVVLGLFNVWML